MNPIWVKNLIGIYEVPGRGWVQYLMTHPTERYTPEDWTIVDLLMAGF